MKLLDFFGKKAKRVEEQEAPKKSAENDLEQWINLHVEVTGADDTLLFVAKLSDIKGDTAELRQFSAPVETEENALPRLVKIRGYDEKEKRGICLEGMIRPKSQSVWAVERLTVKTIQNARAFFRLSTDLEAIVTAFSGPAEGDMPCRLVNISAGGVCITSQCLYKRTDQLRLKVKLLENEPPLSLMCQVLRFLERDGHYEYGCCFLNPTEELREKVAQYIFAVQLKRRETL